MVWNKLIERYPFMVKMLEDTIMSFFFWGVVLLQQCVHVLAIATVSDVAGVPD